MHVHACMNICREALHNDDIVQPEKHSMYSTGKATLHHQTAACCRVEQLQLGVQVARMQLDIGASGLASTFANMHVWMCMALPYVSLVDRFLVSPDRCSSGTDQP